LKSTALSLRRTDGSYWKILQFQFLEGRPFTDDDERDRRMVAVVTRSTADRLVGPGPALGRTVEVEGQRFEVVGVVGDVPPLRHMAYADVWAPLATSKGVDRPRLLGGGTAILLVDSPASIPRVKAAFLDRLAHFESPEPRRWQRAQAPLET